MNQIARELDYIAKMQDILFTRMRKNRQKNVALIPWNTPPEGSQPLNEFDGVAGVGTSGTTVTIMSYVEPDGWDGLIQTIITDYTGTNLIPNSGSIIWALRVNGLYIKGYQNIKSNYGDLSNGLRIHPGVVVKSGQLVEMVATITNAFVPDNDSEILGGVAGFHYPNGVARTN